MFYLQLLKLLLLFFQKYTKKQLMKETKLLSLRFHLNYLEHSKARNYVLRSSMKALEEVCLENGLVRCHRSYFVNPQHIKTLRKEQEGVVYAELDASELQHVPVSKRYMDALSALL